MKKTIKIFIVSLLILLSVSCRRSDISVSQVISQPYIDRNGRMGLALYMRASIKNAENSFFRISDPSGNLSWSIPVNEVKFDDTLYYGTSDITMPLGLMLPIGQWLVELVYKDGRTVVENFNVSYKNADSVLEKYLKEELPVFDAESNLTIVM